MSNPFVNGSFAEVEVHQPPAAGSEPVNGNGNGSTPTGSQASSKHNSWVKFEEMVESNSNQETGEVTTSVVVHPLQQSTPTTSNGTDTSRLSSISTNTAGDKSPAADFATIELSNSIEITHPPRAILQQPVAGSSSGPVSPAQSKSASSGASSPTATGPATVSLTNVAVPNGTSSHFANGDIIVNLLPLNDGWDWVTPAKFKAHLVPEELMSQSLTLTVEEYVSSMSNLLADYRFNFYIVFYKRVLGLWISLGILVLLSILFSGWTGVTLFIAGMLWLFLNALGIFAAIYIKQKLYRMLEQAIAQVNAVFTKHNIFLGVDDRGRYSCHKVNLVFVYFDAKYCVKFLQDMLNNSEQQVLNNNAVANNQAVMTLNNTLQSIDTSDIVITGSTPKNISQKEKYADKLLLRYSQRWIREYNRERIELNSTPSPSTEATTSTSTNGTNGMMNNQQPHPTSTTAAKQSSAATVIPMSPRHCRGHKCFCQFIEEHIKYKPLTMCSFTELLF